MAVQNGGAQPRRITMFQPRALTQIKWLWKSGPVKDMQALFLLRGARIIS
jgi:hypothetical protein